MSDFPGYAAAQRAWENMEPPQPGPHECTACNGKGVIYTEDPMGLGTDEREDCAECDGFGWLTGDGEPYDKNRAEYEADAAADRRREDY